MFPPAANMPGEDAPGGKEKGRGRGPRTKLKLSLRQLPAGITEEQLREIIAGMVPNWDAAMDWFRLVPASKQVPAATAYMHFKSEDALHAVQAKIDGHKLTDAKGKECKVLAEYAVRVPRCRRARARGRALPCPAASRGLADRRCSAACERCPRPVLACLLPASRRQAYQKIPRKKVIDRREGTIDKDAEFLAFVEEFEEQRSCKIESAEAWYGHACCEHDVLAAQFLCHPERTGDQHARCRCRASRGHCRGK